MNDLGALPVGLDDAELVEAVRVGLRGAVGPAASAGLAVSGGPDSVVLAHLAVRARPDVTWRVIHVRHGLRDDAADAQAAADAAAALGLAYDERPAVVPARRRTGLEARARMARYRVLHDVASEHDLAAVCLGHTADDQAETVLLNVARGSGTRGLAGMPTTRQEGRLRLVRPLLRVRRGDVREYAARRGLPTVADPTNDDPQLRRTRVRTEVLPALQRLSGGPGDPVGVLCRLADLAADDAAALDELADERLVGQMATWGPVRAVRAELLDELPRALSSRVVRRLIAAVRGGVEGLPARDVRGVLALGAGKARTVAGGIIVTRGGGWLAAAPAGQTPLAPRPVAFGETVIPELSLRLVACSTSATGVPGDPVVPPWHRVDRDHLSVRVPTLEGLHLRSPRPGEAVRTARGTVGLARLLVDAGVPRPARGLVPVLEGASGEVLWVPGVAADEPHEPTQPAGSGGSWLWLAPLDTDEYARTTDQGPPLGGG